MSLEDVIREHLAAAIRELASAIRESSGPRECPPPEQTDKAPPKLVKPAPETKPVAQKPKAKNSAPSTANEEPVIGFEQAKVKLITIVKDKGREKATALLARFGVEKVTALTPAQYADFVFKAEAVLAGTYDPEAGEQ